MTGLNLESFLRLLRADFGAWASLGAVALVLGLMTWTSWGSRRALRKCLVVSVIAHCALALYGSSVPIVMVALDPDARNDGPRDRLQQVRVTPWTDPTATAPSSSGKSGASGGTMPWDRSGPSLALADARVAPPRPDPPPTAVARQAAAPLASATTVPESPLPPPSAPEERAKAEEGATPEPVAAPVDPAEIAPVVVRAPETAADPPPGAPDRLRPEARPAPDRPAPERPALPGIPELTAPKPKEAVAERPAVPLAPPEGSPPTAIAETGPTEVAAPAVPPREAAVSGLALLDPGFRLQRPEGAPGLAPRPAARPPITLAPSPLFDRSAVPPIEARPRLESLPEAPGATVNPADPSSSGVAVEVVKPVEAAAPSVPMPEMEIPRLKPIRTPVAAAAPKRPASDAGPLALARVTPSGVARLPEVQGSSGGRPRTDVPEVYRSRLDPNRSVLAQRAGASAASEQAVERALDWLARHQDTDGRWDGATAKFDDGTVKKGDDDFTVHCPPGEPCFGESQYWEADTALTGLALLAYLGAGYTHADGKYAETVAKGIDFLLNEQKPDGDLRGPSRAVGMYCHAMATLALCEAYALSGDQRLRQPVERAVNWIVRARAKDGLSWRYAPGAPIGDTSILGWVVLVLKSAKLVGVAVPADTQRGVLEWLGKVSAGRQRGLARYVPGKSPTPTMTAEAWVCRQFLGVGGPGPASAEAADSLLAHGPESDVYNLYYWYYGTLAMYQHGGDSWERWNARVRDELVRRQRARGHPAGSWDPDESQYGAAGGRIYSTALATLSLEVYYRFLRLYDEPRISPNLSPALPRPAGDADLKRMTNPPPPIAPD